MKSKVEYDDFMSTGARHVRHGNHIFLKLSYSHYSLNLTTGGAGVEIVRPPEPNEADQSNLWRIDVSCWTHLAGGVLDGFNAQPNADSRISMLWNPQCPAVHNRVTGSVTGGASVISMLNNKIITIETRMLLGAFPRSSPGDKKSVLTFIDSILRAFPGTFKLGEGDPRHIGTHRDASVSANHVHIAKNGGDEWTDVEMEAMAEMAAKTGAVTAVEAV